MLVGEVLEPIFPKTFLSTHFHEYRRRSTVRLFILLQSIFKMDFYNCLTTDTRSYPNITGTLDDFVSRKYRWVSEKKCLKVVEEGFFRSLHHTHTYFVGNTVSEPYSLSSTTRFPCLEMDLITGNRGDTLFRNSKTPLHKFQTTGVLCPVLGHVDPLLLSLFRDLHRTLIL